MANKVTGSTDTSGALSIAPSTAKSVLLVGKVTGTAKEKHDPNKIFSIVSTSDVKRAFGEESPMVAAAKILISNGVDYISGIITADKPAEPETPVTPPASGDKYTLSFEAQTGYTLTVGGTEVTENNYDDYFTINESTGAVSTVGDTVAIIKVTDSSSNDTTKTVQDLITDGWLKVTKVTADSGVSTAAETDSDDEELYGVAGALQASMDDITIKVIVLEDQTAISDLKSHLELCEENDMFRYAVIAPPTTCIKRQDLINFAKTVNDSRIFIPGPPMVDTNAVVADRVVAAAGLSAVIMTETSDPALPLDSVKIKGLGGVCRRALDSEKKILADNGISPLYTDGSVPAIWRLVTSYLDDKVWQEGTTRFIADYVLETVENTLRANYKRTKNTTRILGDTGIRGTVKSILLRMEELEIIENFDETTLTVVKDPNDMYGALVDYEIDVVTPLYTITVTQHLKL